MIRDFVLTVPAIALAHVVGALPISSNTINVLQSLFTTIETYCRQIYHQYYYVRVTTGSRFKSVYSTGYYLIN